MALSHSPLIVTDGLVFMYDTGNRKSYKGEPTVNLTTDSPSQGGWGGGLSVLDSSTKKFRFNVSNFNGSPGQGWRSFTWDLNSYSGQSVTISATVEVPSASPGTFAWIMMGQGNTHTNTSGAGGYMGYSAASERIQKTTTTTEHITWSGTVGSTGTASQPSGHVGFTVWYNDGTPSTNSYVEVSNVQIEIKSHATQFVNGTRSATAGLIDRTNNAIIDISDASFDSDAQMTFDGTDDYAAISDSTLFDFGTNDFSMDAIVKGTNTSNYRTVFYHFYNPGFVYITNITTGVMRVWINNTVLNGNTNILDGNYHHTALVRQGDTLSLYVDGELDASSTGWSSKNATNTSKGASIGRYIDGSTSYPWNGDILSLKAYNKALTSAEVLQNFNAIKSRFGL